MSCIDRCSSLGPPYMDAPEFAEALVTSAPNRILWGTDWPHSQRYNIGDQHDTGELVAIIPHLLPNEDDRHQVLVQNPLRLFDFK
ncbi:MAG: amidohydrolase family protein [Pseudomonadota bacterium]|nr:amidohydrolase family protein [Pseudomonadota bacterium]